jgi:predicted 2-oxoglutarate/Fe(II)-dependent dioxygenase YbiX
MPAGGAVVFSCALLHAVSPLRTGRRLAFLPFLYDAAHAELKASRHKQYAGG